MQHCCAYDMCILQMTFCVAVGTTTMAMWTVAIVAVGAIYLTRMTLQWLRECSLQGRVVLITGASSGLGEGQSRESETC